MAIAVAGIGLGLGGLGAYYGAKANQKALDEQNKFLTNAQYGSIYAADRLNAQALSAGSYAHALQSLSQKQQGRAEQSKAGVFFGLGDRSLLTEQARKESVGLGTNENVGSLFTQKPQNKKSKGKKANLDKVIPFGTASAAYNVYSPNEPKWDPNTETWTPGGTSVTEQGFVRGMAANPEDYRKAALASEIGGLANVSVVAAIDLQNAALGLGESEIFQNLKENIFAASFEQQSALNRLTEQAFYLERGRQGGSAQRAMSEAFQKAELSRRYQAQAAADVRTGMQALTMFSLEHAQRTALWAEAWVQGLPGISDNYMAAVTALNSFYATNIMPQVLAAQSTAASMLVNAASYTARQTSTAGITDDFIGSLLSIGGGLALKYNNEIADWGSGTLGNMFGRGGGSGWEINRGGGFRPFGQ